MIGINVRAGRMEVCFGGMWVAVCEDGWGVNNSQVVCQQLGFPQTGMYS